MILLQMPFICLEPDSVGERQQLHDLADVYEEGYNYQMDALILPIHNDSMAADNVRVVHERLMRPPLN